MPLTVLQDTATALTPNETKGMLSLLGLAVAVFLRIAWQKAKSFEEVAERTRAIDQTLHGDPKAREPNGLVRKLNHVAGKLDTLAGHFEKHVSDEAQQVLDGNRLRTEANNRLHDRLNTMDDKLQALDSYFTAVAVPTEGGLLDAARQMRDAETPGHARRRKDRPKKEQRE